MRCPEVRETMRQFLDGRVDSKTRKEVGLHLVECEECSRLIEGDKFWDDAVLDLLNREAPADLKAQILADTVGPQAASGPEADSGPKAGSGLDQTSARTQLKIIRWAATRNFSPRQLLEVAAIFIGVMLFTHYFPILFSSGEEDPFTKQGPVVVVTESHTLSPASPLVAGQLSLSGRLF